MRAQHKQPGKTRTVRLVREKSEAVILADDCLPCLAPSKDNPVGSKNSAELKVPHFTRFTAGQIGEESTD
jgi:hypothetical protein